jgi:hypothetical protein
VHAPERVGRGERLRLRVHDADAGGHDGRGPGERLHLAEEGQHRDGFGVVYRCLEGVDAHQYFQSLVTGTPGGEVLTGVGDEAYFHTGSPPFQQATLDERRGQRVVSVNVGFPDPAPCTEAQAKAHLISVADKVFALTP